VTIEQLSGSAQIDLYIEYQIFKEIKATL